jgi:glycosyl transferase family 25
MENIEKIIYINLDKREDRKKEITEQFLNIKLPEEKIIRFSAIETSYPNTGCNLSHAGVLRLAHKMNLKNVLILEDDCNFIDDMILINNNLQRFFTDIKDWDVLLFTETKIKEPVNGYLSICVNTTNACGYLVNNHMFLKLAQLFEDMAVFLDLTQFHWEFQNDIVWNRFMDTKKWYCFNKRLVYQRPGFSDLSNAWFDKSMF